MLARSAHAKDNPALRPPPNAPLSASPRSLRDPRPVARPVPGRNLES